MELTDEGNLAILIELAECDFVTYYDGVIANNKPPAFTEDEKLDT
jgi:hypothetical protein